MYYLFFFCFFTFIYLFIFYFYFLNFIYLFIFKILKSLILTCIPKHEPPSHFPPHNISLGHPHAPAPSILYPVSCIEPRLAIHFLHDSIHVSMPFPKSSHPFPLPQSPKVCSIHLCLLLSHVQGYHYHVSKFHIYVLLYCIGVFLSDFLSYSV